MSYVFTVYLRSTNQVEITNDGYVVQPGTVAANPTVESFPVDSDAKIMFTFTSGVGATVGVKWFEDKTDTSPTLSFQVKVAEIIEYQDLPSSSAGYQPGEEISVYDPSNIGWSAVAVSNETVDGKSVHVFTVTTTDNVITLAFRIADDAVLQGSRQLSPNAVTMDCSINNYWYSSEDSYLAAKVSVLVVDTLKVDLDAGTGVGDAQYLGVAFNTEDKLSVGDRGFFSWRQNSVIDGQSVPVVWSYVTSQSNVQPDGSTIEHSLFFSFPVAQSSTVTLNGRMGIQEPAKDVENTAVALASPLYFISMLAAAVAAIL